MLSAIDHQPTTRACQVLRYNITLAWRGGQCGHSPQHARVNLWAMWATKNKLPTLPTACGRAECGSCGLCGHAHKSRASSTLCTAIRFMRIKLKSHRVRKLYDHFAHRALAPYVYRHLAWAIYPKNHHPKNCPHCPQMNVRKSFTTFCGYALMSLWVN
jgi:hypothetical protein